ncbi:ACC1 [Symbiodinium natans]|uniref:ACC1 protein n=1 Tax=Symbiodinium natans TaxID=878477 RepID=A0A812UY08_9DINO|nr:ACC1 [Symbiodinium natans]
MAAVKAILSMRRWTFTEFGSEQLITFVAMATPDDLNANAEFIRLADSFVEVPSGKNVNNYANVDLICRIAQEQQVDAVWPGWGHASENPKLPAKLKEIGITFIGPPSGVMAALGDKIAANILAQTAKVPSIPWSGDGLTCTLTDEGTVPDEVFNKAMVRTEEEALERAEKVGFPIMVKASEGGGGKGIRKATNMEELKVAFTNVQTEVPGSPIFLMRMVSKARHLEIQILGDEYGNTLALNGRDCSTQRRFQKIFEEGPPTIAKPDVFHEMERAAMRLTALVQYRGAGTVEYLYSPETHTFCFLELNPRLQVEHPVTEAITGVNMPATQLQIAMGIPLYNVPDIRRFYGMDPAVCSKIDFFAVDYPPITSHCCASRITAENPDEGFKPTSGKINSVRFQSAGDCWGYFSVGLKGGIHEFADSQFGHIFAKGPNREAARKSLRFALMNLDISGDIRHPVDYLVDLIETQAYKENTIDTMWLDGLIASKAIAPSTGAMDVVFYAAVFRAFSMVKSRTQEAVEAMQKGQLVLLGKSDTDALVNFPVEITFDGKKFSFQVSRKRSDLYAFTINNKTLKAKVREQPDGSLYVSIGSISQQVKGQEEALGLRLIIGGQTIMVPTVYDPSELRSDVNGKVVRYLHDEGAEVAKGEAYIELEAMKMIMSLKSGEAGKITHALSPGSIVSAGEVLAKLELKDPSKVKKIAPFEGVFEMSAKPEADVPAPREDLLAFLDGFHADQKGPQLVEQLFASFANRDAAAETVRGVLEKYLSNERPFAASIDQKQPYDKLLLDLINQGKDSLEKVLFMVLAHNKLADRSDAVMAAIREMLAAEGSGMSCMYVPDMRLEDDMAGAVQEKIVELSQLPSSAAVAGDYGNVRYLAQQLLDTVPQESYEERTKHFREQLAGLKEEAIKGPPQKKELPGAAPDGGLEMELLVEALSDADAKIQERAMHAYLAWLAAPSRLTKVEVVEKAATKTAVWTQFFPVSSEQEHHRHGLLAVAADLEALNLDEKLLAPLIQRSGAPGVPINLLHLVVGRDAFPGVLKRCQGLFTRQSELLKKAGVGEICVALPQPPRHPRFVKFSLDPTTEEWSENEMGRDLWPSFTGLLELKMLQRLYTLQRIHKEVRPTSHIYLATPLMSGKAATSELLMRALYLSGVNKESFGQSLTDSLDLALEEVEHAMLDPRVAKLGHSVTSRIFVHFVGELDMDLNELEQRFTDTISSHVGHRGSEVIKLCIDEIEVKVHRRVGGAFETLRLSLSSLNGGFLKPKMLREFPDPVTGFPLRWEAAKEGAAPLKSLDHPHVTDQAALSRYQAKRVAARRAGSTYAYDLPGILQLALTMKWIAFTGNPSTGSKEARGESRGARRRSPSPRRGVVSAPSQVPESMPKELLNAVELVMDWSKMELVETERPEGSNDVGMLAWKLTMKTPEYPEGRVVVLIANDVTYQAGSFGVREDQFFQKASELARKQGLPRVYVSCNSGARVGLVEELKPLYKIQWWDEKDCGKGFEYLYLTKEDYESLPAGTVEARKVSHDGQDRYILDAIIGEGLKSTEGGIGVENLKGSGLIAGETSRAYQETFTLSYITGRSVGIGAYLNRLGQRNIQMVSSPMILTGYSALNKLLGKNVYSSQDQLGGPQIMVPNGVTHQVVRDDQEGMSAILDWLSYVPKDVSCLPPVCQPAGADPWDRDVEFEPTLLPYDPRDFLRGVIDHEGNRKRGFFDAGSWTEYLEGWGRTVIVGRARLGGMPMGVIAVETRSVERLVPADPSNPDSCEVKEMNGGKVWFPDSAFKTAQALKDFNRGENLPAIIFANWRGFSGGTRDMYNEILKFGAMIVDALVDYEHPIFIYIPKHGELRGGAWVVIDPAINPDKMEMYADVDARGGILEPPGIVEVKYRAPQQLEAMHRIDARLKELDAKLPGSEGAAKAEVEKDIKVREKQLLPLYTSVATTFADLHDRAGRMKAKNVIRDSISWKDSRRYFFWRVKRRVMQDHMIRRLQKADESLTHKGAEALIQKWAAESGVDHSSDTKMVSWLEAQNVEARAEALRTSYLKSQIQALFSQLPSGEQGSLLSSLKA